MADSDYSMYRFFKGKKENPFDNQKENTQHMFWFYESHFEQLFEKYESSDWYAFFGKNSDKFMKLLTEKDYEKPSDKKGVFDMWLNDYLFIDKLYPEYGGEHWYKKEYYSISVQ